MFTVYIKHNDDVWIKQGYYLRRLDKFCVSSHATVRLPSAQSFRHVSCPGSAESRPSCSQKTKAEPYHQGRMNEEKTSVRLMSYPRSDRRALASLSQTCSYAHPFKATLEDLRKRFPDYPKEISSRNIERHLAHLTSTNAHPIEYEQDSQKKCSCRTTSLAGHGSGEGRFR